MTEAKVSYDAAETRVMPRTVGTCKHSGFGEYDSLTGYVTGNYTSEWTDKQGNRWRSVTTVINLGRPDRGIVVGPDTAMQEEVWEESESVRSQRSTIQANAQRRHNEAMDILVPYMQAHGPVPLTELLPLTKWRARASLAEHLNMFPEVYRHFHIKAEGTVYHWGLHGQEAKGAHDGELR